MTKKKNKNIYVYVSIGLARFSEYFINARLNKGSIFHVNLYTFFSTRKICNRISGKDNYNNSIYNRNNVVLSQRFVHIPISRRRQIVFYGRRVSF